VVSSVSLRGWHEVELLCPVCQAWRHTGAATTRENFESHSPAVLGGRVVLPCGHEVTAEDHQARFGPEIQSTRQ
jgi:hypothetical protein